MRAKKPIVIIDAYYDGEGQALCPAATGISHHINPWGDIEPCPIVQFTKESIHAKAGTTALAAREVPQSEFLRDFRELAQQTTRGCIVLERPDLLKQLVEKHGAGRRRSAARPWRNWRRCRCARRSTTPGTKSPRRTGSTGWRSGSGSTISASTTGTTTRSRPLPGVLAGS